MQISHQNQDTTVKPKANSPFIHFKTKFNLLYVETMYISYPESTPAG